jgi:hypothetical protein
MTPVRVSSSAVGVCGLNRSIEHQVCERGDVILGEVGDGVQFAAGERTGPPSIPPLAPSVGFRAFELERHHKVIADNPRVVSRLNHVRVAGCDLSFGSIVVHHSQSASHDGSNVTYLTRVGAGHRLHTLGPPPSRLEGETSNRLLLIMFFLICRS